MSAALDLLNILVVAVVFVTMISILVAAHELGHYLFARLFKMGVEEFAIGFGKRPLVTYMKRFYNVPLAPGQDPMLENSAASDGSRFSLEGHTPDDRVEVREEGGRTYLRERTDFTIRPWPLGGFVRIKGMMPEEDGSETRVPGGFYSKPPWQRVVVLFAGPLFSVLAGLAIMIPLLMFHGVEKPTNEPVLGSLTETEAGYKAGLRKGDRVVAVNGKPIGTFFEMTRIVREQGGKPVTFVVLRGDERKTISVVPKLDNEPTAVLNADWKPSGEKRIQGKIGAGPPTKLTRLGFNEAVKEAVIWPVRAVEGLIRIFSRPQEIKENVGGPGTMIAATNQAIKMGVPYVLWLSAILSISVGIFNLLPAPPLDGGQMAIAFAEMFRGGRRLSMRVQIAVGTAGTLFVVGLILTALAVDVQRLALDPKKPPAAAKEK